MRTICALFLAALAIATFMIFPAAATTYSVGELPLDVKGYVTQGGAIGLTGDHYDTEKGLQSAIFNLFTEAELRYKSNLRFYTSLMLTGDWIYDIKHDQAEWNDKQFAKSRDRLYMDTEYWQVLKEAHVTWTPEHFLFRFGKQAVSWGEMDLFRINDQITPLYQRRGSSDVELDALRMPIWMLRAEYYPTIEAGWLKDLSAQFIFNPNITFIRNQTPVPGNDVAGIWAPAMNGPDYIDATPVGIPGLTWIPTAALPVLKGMLPPPVYAAIAALPRHNSVVGSWELSNTEVRSFDSGGFEYGLRLKGTIGEGILALMGYYGLDKDIALRVTGLSPVTFTKEGTPIAHVQFEAKYPLFRFVGASYSNDIPALAFSALGGVAPLLRLEAMYAYQNTFTGEISQQFRTYDEFRYGIGVDWKVKVPILNPLAYFSIMPQLYARRILDYPSDERLQYSGALIKENNYQASLTLSTSYLHNKLNPSFTWIHDMTSRADYYRYQVVYDYNDAWHFTLGAMQFYGAKAGEGLEVFRNKDQCYFKTTYKFN
ncbi:MAG: hypothetical protein A4E64_01806 [Syntrophorhabdus sp. PtaU1.Bin058]|nr:MAG: hypothetical protein A4E64_01806 [Syntrophorhabdus sp. PtaU1.Bin058]